MNPHPYRNAYDAAINQLTEITDAFERLRERKSQIEGLILALQPFFESSEQAIPQHSDSSEQVRTAESLTSNTEAPEGYSFRDVPNPLPDISETGGDPFQRRVKTTFRFKGLATQRSF